VTVAAHAAGVGEGVLIKLLDARHRT
jgi:hypothetical protein